MQILQRVGVAAGIVANGQDLIEDPQLSARGHFKWLKHSEIGAYLVDNLPFRLSLTPCETQFAAPCLGEHTEYVCTKILGMSDEEFVELVQAGVLE